MKTLDRWKDFHEEIDRLRALNAELLEALEAALPYLPNDSVAAKARIAIVKAAKERKP
jgi:hypothetical protein